jgi:pimeloyl-ACP methyl ester carboxylesterase
MSLASELRFCVLPDKRRLAYAEYGAPEGRAVFYFHGFPGSHAQIRLVAEHARALNLRLIAPDRPGIGHSDFQAQRRLLDWPEDVRALADHLAIEKFSVLGISGGGPYALACAYALRARLRVAAVVVGLGPLDVAGMTKGMMPLVRNLLFFSRHAPPLGLSLAYGVGWQLQTFGEAFYRAAAYLLPAPDQAIFARAEIRALINESVQEALRLNYAGSVYELNLYTRPWGFALNEIHTPVLFWYGGRDTIVPPVMGEYQSALLPHCQTFYEAEEGHYSLAFGQQARFLSALAQAWR